MKTQTAIAGRVTKFDLDLPDDIQKVEITTRPENGTLTVDPDQQTLSYVSSDPGFSGRMQVGWSVTHADGRIETVEEDLSVETGTQKEGWGGGESHYMLRTDENDDVVVETGDNHRKVYVSGSDDALSQADIEQMEGRDFRSDWEFGQFLKDNPQYGGSEDMALDAKAGEAVWMTVTGRDAEPSSNWLMFERGYDYDMGRLINRGTQGEDALHPIHVTAWGEGDAPVMTDRPQFFQEPSDNIVITDIAFADGVRILEGENLLFENVSVGGDEMIVQNANSVTVRQSDFLDIIRDAPTGSNWNGAANDRKQGIYSASSEGLLIEQTLFDHTGWEEGYNPNGNGASLQPPTKFSHNVYLQFDTLDVTFRDNVTMRAASTGAQLRGGAFAEDNLYLDNNVAGNFGGGSGVSGGVKSGNYSFINGNLVTSAAHKDGLGIGALSMGFDDFAKQSTLLGNIIAHLANPDDAREITEKYWAHDPLNDNGSRFFDDTIIYNWDTAYPYNGVAAHNTDGLDTAAMADTTIQRYAADLLGTDTATIDDLAQHLRQVVRQGGDLDVDDILNYFRAGFGQDLVGERNQADTVTFVPSELGEGTRWDNRVNWDKGDLPIDGDVVDLNGSHVTYGGSVDLAALDLGGTGVLALGYGYLGVDELQGGGRLDIDDAGQFWVGEWSGSGTLEVDLDGGRFFNTGRMGGAAEIEATDGELVLATGGGRFDLDGGTLEIVGDEAKVGFDGTDGRAAGLDLEGGTLGFIAEDGAFGQVGAFRTGAFETHDVTSLIDLDGGRIEIDLGDLQGGGTHSLLAADGLGGVPDDVVVTGLGGRDAVVRVDLAEDRVDLMVSTGGSGQSRVEVVEETAGETDAEAALWQTIPSEGTVPGTPETEPEMPEEGDADPDPEEVMPDPTPEPETGDDEQDPDPEVPEDEDAAPDPAPEPETGDGEQDPDPEMPEDEDAAPDPAPEPEIGDGEQDPDPEMPNEDDTEMPDEDPAFVLDLSAPDTDGMTMRGGTAGSDRIVGVDGDDWIAGEGENDHLEGGRGNDALFGSDGQDRLSGDDGDDHLDGGNDNDHLLGGDGGDVLVGGDGWDRLFGDAGDDILTGGDGTDMLAGGSGADQFVFDISADLGGGDVDQIHDFDADEGDRIVLIDQDGALDHDFDATADLPVLRVEIDGGMRDVAKLYGDGTMDLATIDEGAGYLILG